MAYKWRMYVCLLLVVLGSRDLNAVPCKPQPSECVCYNPDGRGCVVAKPAPLGLACKCLTTPASLLGRPIACIGRDVPCLVEDCLYPDPTCPAYCLGGGGNCDGYSGPKPANCECGTSPKGCFITRPSPANWACKCDTPEGLPNNQCTGETIPCMDPQSPYCIRPDTTTSSCLLGGGNCKGYVTANGVDPSMGCNCMNVGFQNPACRIQFPSPSNSACRCDIVPSAGGQQQSYQCIGSMVPCTNPQDPRCARPDVSLASCQLGGGNCDGYNN